MPQFRIWMFYNCQASSPYSGLKAPFDYVEPSAPSGSAAPVATMRDCGTGGLPADSAKSIGYCVGQVLEGWPTSYAATTLKLAPGTPSQRARKGDNAACG